VRQTLAMPLPRSRSEHHRKEFAALAIELAREFGCTINLHFVEDVVFCMVRTVHGSNFVPAGARDGRTLRTLKVQNLNFLIQINRRSTAFIILLCWFPGV